MLNLTHNTLLRTPWMVAMFAACWGGFVPAVQGQASNETTVVREWNETLLHAIRNDLARPTIHARNLHHWSMACYDAWAAYDTVATPFLVDVELPYIEDEVSRRWAQETAINYASYRLLWNRFLDSPGGTSTLMTLYQQFALAGGVNSFQSTDYVNDGPAALGNFIAQQVMAYGAADGSNEANGHANQHYTPANPDLFIESVPGNPWLVQPNRWQSISLSTFVGQSGIPETETPPFLSPEWGNVTPFGLPDSAMTLHFANDGWPYPVWMRPRRAAPRGLELRPRHRRPLHLGPRHGAALV